MKKSGLMDGAFIATAAIIISKVMGVLYVIPFYSIIGEHGGSLYGYAYNIYNLFLIISSAGIPLAISKITSEYNALGKTNEKKYMYSYTKKIIWFFSIASFLLCFLGAPLISQVILGDLTGGNTLADVTLVIRCVSVALLVVPLLSIYRGYLQGHKYITDSSLSQVIEQIIRIAIILAGSAVAIYIFKLPVSYAVGLAMFGAAGGALIGYVYLSIKAKKIVNKEKVTNVSRKEKKEIKRKLIHYAVPFIIVNASFYLYSTTDMILIIRVLDHLNFNAHDIETISSIFTTWGIKLNSVITAIASGLVISLIPTMVASFAKGNMKEVNYQYSKAFDVLVIVILPISLFFSIHATEIWTAFYGESYYGPIVFRFLSILAFFDSLHIIIGSILQNLNKNKLIYLNIIIGLGLNLILDIPLMLLFNKLDIYPYYGAIAATLIAYTVSTGIIMFKLKKEINISYNLKKVAKNILITILLLIPINIFLASLVTEVSNRLHLVLYLGLFGLISLIIYYFINRKFLGQLVGNKFLNKVFNFKK